MQFAGFKQKRVTFNFLGEFDSQRVSQGALLQLVHVGKVENLAQELDHRLSLVECRCRH